MAITLSETTGVLKKFRKTAWKFQLTFQTLPKDLPTFVTTIVSSAAAQPLKGGELTVDQTPFEPKHLNTVLASHSITRKSARGLSLIAADSQEAAAVLLAALSDSTDFLFTPDPKPFVIYADHHEYTTFYAQTRSNLNRVADALTRQGFKSVPGYERRL